MLSSATETATAAAATARAATTAAVREHYDDACRTGMPGRTELGYVRPRLSQSAAFSPWQRYILEVAKLMRPTLCIPVSFETIRPARILPSPQSASLQEKRKGLRS